MIKMMETGTGMSKGEYERRYRKLALENEKEYFAWVKEELEDDKVEVLRAKFVKLKKDYIGEAYYEQCKTFEADDDSEEGAFVSCWLKSECMGCMDLQYSEREEEMFDALRVLVSEDDEMQEDNGQVKCIRDTDQDSEEEIVLAEGDKRIVINVDQLRIELGLYEYEVADKSVLCHIGNLKGTYEWWKMIYDRHCEAMIRE